MGIQVPTAPNIDDLVNAITDPGSVLPRRGMMGTDVPEPLEYWAARAVAHIVGEQPTYASPKLSMLRLVPLDAFEYGVRQDLGHGPGTAIPIDGMTGDDAARTARRLARTLGHGYVPVQRRTASEWMPL